MAFQERALGLVSRLHMSEVPKPVFAAVGGVLAIALAVALGPALFGGGGNFEVVRDDTATEADGGEESGAGESLAEGSLASTDGGEGAWVAAEIPSEASAELCVHVDGAVAAPGVYRLPVGSRVVDAVEAAGGFAEDAVTAAVNQAQVLADGQQVVVPAKGDELPPAAVGADTAPGADAAADSGLVNINKASVAELTTLKGIGQATAEKIVADREKNGPFKSIEDLKRVSGIGDKKLDALRDSVCL